MAKQSKDSGNSKATQLAHERLVALGREMVQEINANESPSFMTPVRSRSNVKVDAESGVLYLGDSKEKRTFVHVSQAKKFMQTVAIASKLKSFLEQGLHTSIRGLYYQLKFTIGEDVD
ncbi:MAG: hypothetical protein QXU54_03620, partial [Candidatus Micrarchaeia archaeon]